VAAVLSLSGARIADLGTFCFGACEERNAPAVCLHGGWRRVDAVLSLSTAMCFAVQQWPTTSLSSVSESTIMNVCDLSSGVYSLFTVPIEFENAVQRQVTCVNAKVQLSVAS
jgi:hypothetical protein